MREGCIKLGIAVVVLALIIYLVKNKEEIFNLLNSRIKSKKIIKKIVYIFIILGIICCLIILIRIGISYYKLFNISEENEQSFIEADEKIKREKEIYSNLMEKNYENQNYMQPYMLDGFSYVEGSYENGYVIQDENENQYVWIPCTNKNINNIVKLQRRNRVASPFINYNSCYNESYEKFIESALENGGFYISRYEIGNDNNSPVSKKDATVWTNITRDEATEVVSLMYNNVNCELINGYAYDTTLKWIEESSNVKLQGSIVEIKNDDTILSGRTINNNIYDFCDNILEYSLENLYDTIVVRGFVNSNSTQYTNSAFSKESRYCIQLEDSSLGLVTPIAIRTVLYK